MNITLQKVPFFFDAAFEARFPRVRTRNQPSDAERKDHLQRSGEPGAQCPTAANILAEARRAHCLSSSAYSEDRRHRTMLSTPEMPQKTSSLAALEVDSRQLQYLFTSDIGRGTTYVTTESYFLDFLACLDSHLTHQLHAVNDEDDCRAQMAALTTMRAVLPRFIRQDLRRGPFLLSLTDFHQSNIFVDDEWNIKYLIDLELACSLPMEMQHPPYWLTSQTVDGLVGEHLLLFDKTYRAFLNIFAHEEALLLPATQGQQAASLLRTGTMRRGWEDGNFFCFLALDSISGLYGLFIQHIQPRFHYGVDYDAFDRTVSPYWRAESERFITTKVQQKSEYDRLLREIFKKQGDD